MPLYFTMRIIDVGDGRTGIQQWCIRDEPADPEAVRVARGRIEHVASGSREVMRELFENAARAMEKSAP